MARTETLIHLHYSPWSECARWALDHHGLKVRRRAYMPMVGEPLLRLKLGKKKVSVPALIGDGWALGDSLEIAMWADEHGNAAPLRVADSDVQAWNDRAMDVLSAGRARTTARAVKIPAVLLESVPPPLDKLGKLALPIARQGAKFLQRKYATDASTLDGHAATMDRGLAALSKALGGDKPYIFDAFSYADVAMACALAFVKPVADNYIKLGPESRKCWKDPDISPKYEHLIAWRDGVYARHR